MHVLKRKVAASRAAIIAATLGLAAGLAGPVFAEDPAPGNNPNAPVIAPAEPAPPAAPAAGSAASAEENPCFTGKGSIKDVLDMDWAAGVSILGQDGMAIPARNIWYYYELTIDKTALTVTLHINNVLDITAPLPPTVAAMASFDITWLAENGAVSRVDDIYMLDTESPNGELLVDRLGPIQVPLRLPTNDVLGQWSPAAGTSHWPQVGLLPPSNESFIRSATSGAQDLFESATPLPDGAGRPTAPIFAVGVIALAQKGDIDNRQLGLVVGALGNQKEVVDTTLSVVPEYSVAIFEKAPGDIAWDAASVLNTPFGVVVRP